MSEGKKKAYKKISESASTHNAENYCYQILMECAQHEVREITLSRRYAVYE